MKERFLSAEEFEKLEEECIESLTKLLRKKKLFLLLGNQVVFRQILTDEFSHHLRLEGELSDKFLDLLLEEHYDERLLFRFKAGNYKIVLSIKEYFNHSVFLTIDNLNGEVIWVELCLNKSTEGKLLEYKEFTPYIKREYKFEILKF